MGNAAVKYLGGCLSKTVHIPWPYAAPALKVGESPLDSEDEKLVEAAVSS